MVCASLGAAILFWAGTQWDTAQLVDWGWLALLLSLVLIMLGLYPYRKLTQLELNPNQLIITPDTVTFLSAGKAFFALPHVAVASLSYHQDDSLYGIKVCLREGPETKIRLLTEHFDAESYVQRNRKRLNCDLFFPFFSERSLRELQDAMSEDAPCS